MGGLDVLELPVSEMAAARASRRAFLDVFKVRAGRLTRCQQRTQPSRRVRLTTGRLNHENSAACKHHIVVDRVDELDCVAVYSGECHVRAAIYQSQDREVWVRAAHTYTVKDCICKRSVSRLARAHASQLYLGRSVHAGRNSQAYAIQNLGVGILKDDGKQAGVAFIERPCDRVAGVLYPIYREQQVEQRILRSIDPCEADQNADWEGAVISRAPARV